MTDVEKAESISDAPRTAVLESGDTLAPKWHQRLLSFGVETHGMYDLIRRADQLSMLQVLLQYLQRPGPIPAIGRCLCCGPACPLIYFRMLVPPAINLCTEQLNLQTGHWVPCVLYCTTLAQHK